MLLSALLFCVSSDSKSDSESEGHTTNPKPHTEPQRATPPPVHSPSLVCGPYLRPRQQISRLRHVQRQRPDGRPRPPPPLPLLAAAVRRAHAARQAQQLRMRAVRPQPLGSGVRQAVLAPSVLARQHGRAPRPPCTAKCACHAGRGARAAEAGGARGGGKCCTRAAEEEMGGSAAPPHTTPRHTTSRHADAQSQVVVRRPEVLITPSAARCAPRAELRGKETDESRARRACVTDRCVRAAAASCRCPSPPQGQPQTRAARQRACAQGGSGHAG